MARRNGLQSRQPVGQRLADAHEDAGGVGDGELAGGFERGETAGGHLVGRAPVAVEVGVQRLDHHALAGRHLPQRRQLAGGHGAGVGVGEQAGLVAHEAAHLDLVVDGGVPAVLCQPVRRRGVAQLGALAEGEQRLVAAGPCAAGGDLEHLLRRQVGRVEPGGGLGERAVAALVAAQHREGDEHLRAVGDACAERAVAHRCCPLGQFGQRQLGQRQRRRRGLRRHCAVRHGVLGIEHIDAPGVQRACALGRIENGHRAPPFVGCC